MLRYTVSDDNLTEPDLDPESDCAFEEVDLDRIGDRSSDTTPPDLDVEAVWLVMNPLRHTVERAYNLVLEHDDRKSLVEAAGQESLAMWIAGLVMDVQDYAEQLQAVLATIEEGGPREDTCPASLGR